VAARRLLPDATSVLGFGVSIALHQLFKKGVHGMRLATVAKARIIRAKPFAVLSIQRERGGQSVLVDRFLRWHEVTSSRDARSVHTHSHYYSLGSIINEYHLE
jgi:hypothetical protein